MVPLGRSKEMKTLYLFLDAVELQHLYDERSCASFVVDGPQQGAHVVHAEGLRPAPVPPAFDADVEQLERRPERETNTNTAKTEDTRHERLGCSPCIYPQAKASKQQETLFGIFW